MTAAARSAGESGVIGHLQSGHNSASAAKTAPQCGHLTVSSKSAVLFSELSCGPLDGLDKSASIRFLSAFLANTINLKGVAGGQVAVFASYLLFELSDFL